MDAELGRFTGRDGLRRRRLGVLLVVAVARRLEVALEVRGEAVSRQHPLRRSAAPDRHALRRGRKGRTLTCQPSFSACLPSSCPTVG